MSGVNGLVHYWPLNEASGATVTDTVGGIASTVVHDDAAGSDTVVAGWLGNARDLSKYDDLWLNDQPHGYIKVFGGTPDRTYTLNQWTLGISFYLPSDYLFTLYPMLAWFGDYFAVDEYVLEVVFYPWSGVAGDPPDTIYVDIYKNEALVGVIEHRASAALTNGWHQILITANSTGIKLMLDGAATGSPMVDWDTKAPIVINDMPLMPKIDEAWIGSNSSTGDLAGIVDEIQIWDRALSPAAAASLWNGGTGTAAIDYANSLTVDTDWADDLDPLLTRIYYACEVDDGILDPVRIPISSWQATIQADRSSFAQAVIPNVAAWIAILEARPNAEFIISRGALFGDGSTQETELARAPLSLRYDEGPTNSTGTISGYRTVTPRPLPETRTLRNVRSVSTYGANVRARADVDFFLRPGDTAIIRGDSVTVAWINYYANASDQYMDVGTRAL